MVVVEREEVLVTPESIKPSSKLFKVFGTFNPGAARLPNGDILLYVRVGEMLKKWEDSKHCYSPRFVSNTKYELTLDKFKKEKIQDINPPYSFYFKDGTLRLTYVSHLRRVLLDKSGLKVKKIEQKPSFYGTAGDGEFGVEDGRITYLPKEKLYLMSYVSLSRLGNISTSLAVSHDCYHWHRRGIIFRDQNKDVVIFPEKINEKYISLNRPEGNFEFTLPHIWISFSKDLDYWGKDKILHVAKENSWDSGKIGAGTPPIKTKYGWLTIYHGVQKIRKEEKWNLKHMFAFHKKHLSKKYSAGVLLHDLKDPTKIIAKSESDSPLLFPKHDYEKEGFVDNVIFPTGAILDETKKYLLIFSGAADRVTTVKKISLEEIWRHLKIR